MGQGQLPPDVIAPKIADNFINPIYECLICLSPKFDVSRDLVAAENILAVRQPMRLLNLSLSENAK